MTARRMKHELTYVEIVDFDTLEPDGVDYYVCTCGLRLQANGDVLAAFEHGQETAPTQSEHYEEQVNAR